MDYGKYKEARNASWQCIIDYKINSLPIKITEIIKQCNSIKLYKNSKVDMLPDDKNAMTIYHNNIFYIIYNDLDSSARCRFSITHEFGHIVLGHIIIDTSTYKTFEVTKENESACNVFARDLLAPACVLHEIQALSPEQIKNVCNISYNASCYRAERMKILEARNKYYLHPLERQVKEQFTDYIKKYRSQSCNSESGENEK